jgi:hypothetical protein
MGYVVQDFFFMIMSFIFLYVLRPLADEEDDWIECVEVAGGGHECFGISQIIRMSFALFVYHLLILMLICPRAHCSKYIHDGGWCFKSLLISVLYTVCYFIPYQFFQYGWLWVSRVGSIIFLIVQSYFMLDAGYRWNSQLMAHG